MKNSQRKSQSGRKSEASKSQSKGKQQRSSSKKQSTGRTASRKGSSTRKSMASNRSKASHISQKQNTAIQRKSQKKDEGLLPERPMSAYAFFANDNIPKIKKEEKVNYMEAAKKVGNMWLLLDDKQIAKYKKLEEEDKKRYEKQMKEFEKKRNSKIGSRSSMGSQQMKKDQRQSESSKKKKPEYKLHYFEIYGRAEKIRMLLTHAKQPFEDVKFFSNEFNDEIKHSGLCEFGRAPVLEYKGKSYAQTNSILRLLGQLHGYYPDDPFQAWEVESLLAWTDDFLEQWWGAYVTPKEKLGEAVQTLCSEHMHFYLEKIDKRLEQNQQKHKKSKFIATDKMTIADFDQVMLAYDYLLNEGNYIYKESKKVVEKFPRVLSYYEGLKEELKDYMAERPQQPF